MQYGRANTRLLTDVPPARLLTDISHNARPVSCVRCTRHAGVYKYVLLKLRKRGGEEERYLVRGSAVGEYHDDIYQAARRALAGDGHGTGA
ncbi:hypothetical protein EON66_06475 [archaeon]|nr:MAG: hypothetical protein EON66_06475 [archaeon]